MSSMGFFGDRGLVVFGFGPIGAGLFVHEAFRTGAYRPPLVVDVQVPLLTAIRAHDGRVSLNVAQADGVTSHEVGPVETANPDQPADRDRIVAAIADADFVATCLPGTASYARGDEASPARLIAAGLARRRRPDRLVLYAAENAVNAAGGLIAAIDAVTPGLAADRVDARDTVIGKMSGVQADPDVIRALRLAPLTPGYPAAILVEAFDAILVSGRPGLLGAITPEAPGFPTFRAVADLEPFEFAKLYGHNATHALGAFLGVHLGLGVFADLVQVEGALRLLAEAFELESGAALVGRFAGAGPLFTEAGYRAYANDLLTRMTNPYLHDSIERAARDPARKLGWDDRLVGTIRVCLGRGIEARRYALGAAAGLAVLEPDVVNSRVSVREALGRCWPNEAQSSEEAGRVFQLVEDGLERLRPILASGRITE